MAKVAVVDLPTMIREELHDIEADKRYAIVVAFFWLGQQWRYPDEEMMRAIVLSKSVSLDDINRAIAIYSTCPLCLSDPVITAAHLRSLLPAP